MNEHRQDELTGAVIDAQDLCDIQQFDAALMICQRVEVECSRFDDPDLAELMAETLLCKGTALAGLRRFEDELLAYMEVVKRFDSIESPVVQVLVSRALFNAAVASGEIGEVDESLARYSSFVDRYQTSREPEIQKQVAHAMLNRGITLKQCGRPDEACAVYEKLIEQFRASEDPGISSKITTALALKAGMQMFSGRLEAAGETARQGLLRCDGAKASTEQFHCHLVLAASSLLQGSTGPGEREVVSILNLLPELDETACVEQFSSLLLSIATTLGIERTLKLVLQSPSAEILSSAAEDLEDAIAFRAENLRNISDLAEEIASDLANSDRFKT